MSDFSKSLDRLNYISLVECLISLLQTQLLQMIKVHGAETDWVNKFTNLYTKIANFEIKFHHEPNFSLNCKELFQYCNRNTATQQRSRRKKEKSIDFDYNNKGKIIFRQTSIATAMYPTVDTDGMRKSSVSKYYSKIMDGILQKKPKSRQIGKRMMIHKDDKDFWLIGDEIEYIN